MAKILVYTANLCPYCHMAKALLSSKGVTFDEINVTGDQSMRARMSQEAGGRSSVPQIWIDETHVGGCDDLHALDRAGKLDGLLSK